MNNSKIHSQLGVQINHYLAFELKVDFECKYGPDETIFTFKLFDYEYNIDITDIHTLNQFKHKMEEDYVKFLKGTILYHQQVIKYHTHLLEVAELRISNFEYENKGK